MLGICATIDAVLASVPGWHLLADLLLLSAFGGAYSVPLYVLLQERSAPTHRARMVAANNVMNAIASVLAAGLTAGFYAAGMGAPRILILVAIGNVAVAFWIFRTVRRGV